MKKILFIEDDPYLQKLFIEFLRKKDYRVFPALEGLTGIKIAKEKSPDLIILDLIIPEMDGFTILEKLKKDEETKNIPVIVLTNLESAQDIERVMKEGAAAYFIKSKYSLQEIEQKIREYL